MVAVIGSRPYRGWMLVMGARGPRPIPVKLKVLRGETRPSRLNRAEPRPQPHRPKMPADLTQAAASVWRKVMREMGATGVITAADAEVLRAYCEACARYQFAARMLEQSGPLVRGQKGELVKNPLHQIVRDNAALLRSLARELGLTPATRAGMSGHQAEERDPFADFLDGA
jgi:P27 family predicted phage terminase small subunit